MQQETKTYANRFEDMDDMFDYLLETMQDFMRDYVVFSKLHFKEDCPFADAKELLTIMVLHEFEDLWERARIDLHKITKGYSVNISFDNQE